MDIVVWSMGMFFWVEARLTQEASESLGVNTESSTTISKNCKAIRLWAAIALSSGIPNSPLNGYAPVVDALVVHNTVINCEQSLRVGVGENSKGRSVPPKSSTIAYNLFLPRQREVLKDPGNLSGISFTENVCRKERSIHESDRRLKCRYARVSLKRAEDGLMRPKTDKRRAAESASKLKWDLSLIHI